MQSCDRQRKWFLSDQAVNPYRTATCARFDCVDAMVGIGLPIQPYLDPRVNADAGSREAWAGAYSEIAPGVDAMVPLPPRLTAKNLTPDLLNKSHDYLLETGRESGLLIVAINPFESDAHGHVNKCLARMNTVSHYVKYGSHMYWFAAPDNFVVHTSHSSIDFGLTVYGDGGMVDVPPTVQWQGEEVLFRPTCEPWSRLPSVVPLWLEEMLIAKGVASWNAEPRREIRWDLTIRNQDR